MFLRVRIQTARGAPPAHAHQRTHQRKSLLCSCALVALAAVLFALPAHCLAADSGDEARAANGTAAATADTKLSVPSTVPHLAAINSEIYARDTVSPTAPPGASEPGTLAPLGALPLVGIAGEPAPARRCFLVMSSLCAAAKNKPIVALATIQTAALIADGVTTRQYLKRGYVEVDPLTRILIGRRPTWARMAPLGTLQVFAGMWLAERMETSRHAWIRRLCWLPQVIGIAGNTLATANNLRLR